MFDGVAPRYELLNSVMTFGQDRSWRRRTLQLLALSRRSIVLDLASGTGDLSRGLLELGLQPVSLDLSEGMLRATRNAAFPLVMADGAELPIATAAMDGVVSGFALRNFADLDATLAECARVLRPRGRLALLEVDTPSNPLIRLGHGVWFRFGVPLLGALLSAREAYRYLPRSVAYLPSPVRLAEMLRAAGFTDVERRRLFFGTVQIVTATREGAYGIVAEPPES